ncbi:hypothetical protein MMPV_002493 [Pyropia vietnamensis]
MARRVVACGTPTLATAVAVAVAAVAAAAVGAAAAAAASATGTAAGGYGRPAAASSSCVGDIKAVTFRLAPPARTPSGVYAAGVVPDDPGLPPFLRGAALNLTALRRHWYSGGGGGGGDDTGGGGGGWTARTTDGHYHHWWSRRRHRHRPSFKVRAAAPYVAGAGVGRGRAHLVAAPGEQTLLALRFGWADPAAQGGGGLAPSCGRLGFAGTAVGSPATGWDVSGTAFHAFRRPTGLRLVRSSQSVAAGVEALEKAIASGGDGVRQIGRVDHDVAAAKVDLRLAPSVVVAFGGVPPVAATFLAVAAAGVSVPPEVAVADSPLGVPYVMYNAASTLKVRFDLPASVDAALTSLEAIQARLASAAAGVTVAPTGADYDAAALDAGGSGLSTQTSNSTTADAAWARLTAALDAAPVTVAYLAQHDLSVVAAGGDPGGKFNRAAVFGNPKLGTPIMQSAFTAGIDLPVKLGVYTEVRGKDAEVSVAYVQPEWVANRHGTGVDVSALTTALDNFSNAAIAPADK